MNMVTNKCFYINLLIKGDAIRAMNYKVIASAIDYDYREKVLMSV